MIPISTLKETVAVMGVNAIVTAKIYVAAVEALRKKKKELKG